MLNTDTLKGLLTDPELRTQVLQLLKKKVHADALTAEAHAYMARQMINVVRGIGGGTAAATALRDMIKEYLNNCEALVNRQFEFSKTLMDKLQPFSESTAPAPTTVTMNLSAAQHAVVRTQFRVENIRSASISVGFETSSFISEDGNHRVAAEIVFDPPSLELQSKQEARIELILQVSDQFKPNTTYLATVTVHGLNAPQLLIRLDVQSTRQEPGPPPPAAGSKTADAAVADGIPTKLSRQPKSKTKAARRTKSSQAKRKAP